MVRYYPASKTIEHIIGLKRVVDCAQTTRVHVIMSVMAQSPASDGFNHHFLRYYSEEIVVSK